MHKLLITSLAVAAAGVAACSGDHTTTPAAPASQLAVSMASTFSTTPAGYGNLSSSFDASGSGGAFEPLFDDHGGRGHGGFDLLGHGPGFGLGFMGGGLAGAFMGDWILFHPDHNCSFSSASGVTCTDSTHDGLVATRTAKYTTTAGAVEQHIDSLTNSVATTTSVSGTVTRRDSSTSTVNESSAQTIVGLTPASTQITVNGASKGSESSTGKSPEGSFTSSRTTGDTINGIVIPKPTSGQRFPFPTAGTIIRAMNATVTITGQSPASSARREVVTYNGSDTAKVVITQDDSTQNCKLPLPHGRLICS